MIANKIFRTLKILPMMLLLVVFSSVAIAGDCSDLTLSFNPAQFTVGDTNSKVKLAINPPGTPLDVWKEYDNATVNMDGTLKLLDVSLKNLIGFAQTSHSWPVNSTLASTHNVNVTLVNSTGNSCVVSNTVTSLSQKDVQLNISVEDLGTLKLNQAITASVTLNNTGADSALDIDANLDSIYASEARSVSSISGNTAQVESFTFTPNTCGTGKTMTAYARNFHDGQGTIFNTISAADSFDVIGSDLTVLNVGVSSLTPQEGGSITINATVKNDNGTDTAFNGKVTFYYDQVAGSNKIGEVNFDEINLTINNETIVSRGWTVVSSGNHTIIAVASADNECPTNNNQRQSLSLSASAKPVETTNDPGPSGSSSSGGTVSRRTTITTEGPSATTRFVVVAAGTTANVRVSNKDIPVDTVQIDVAKRVEDFEVTVIKLDDAPTSKLEAGTGTVYSYLKIETDNLDDSDITEARVRFRVTKSWLSTNDYLAEEVVLARLVGSNWQDLETVIVSSSGDIVFEAKSPGFSTFAIVARNAEEQLKAQGKVVEETKEPETPEIKPIEPKQPEEPEIEEVEVPGITGAFAATLKNSFVGKNPVAVTVVIVGLIVLALATYAYQSMSEEKPAKKKKAKKKKK
jgi:PGF-pre-PGF domain-containing protein